MVLAEDSGARDASLPATNELAWAEFEDYTEELLSANRFATGQGPRITRVSRWGRPGDKQDGIDFEGEFSDGTSATWQCKAYRRLVARQVHAAVTACTYAADQHYLVYSGKASPGARTAIKQHPGWELIDRRDLFQLLCDIPVQRHRDILDRTWGRITRKQLLAMPGADAFESIDALCATRLTLPVLNDLGTMINRQSELNALQSALEGEGTIVIVAAVAGMGKSRLAAEALRTVQQRNPTVPVLSLIPAHQLADTSLDELPHCPAILFVDDGHERPDAIKRLLQYVLRNPQSKLMTAVRKHNTTHLSDLFVNAGFPSETISTIDLTPLTPRHAYALVESLSHTLSRPLTYAAKSSIARLAEEAPYLGVLAIDSIRRGALTDNLTLSTDLRSAVHASYRQAVTGTVHGFDPRSVELLLATCAAIGGVLDLDDHELRSAMMSLCGLAKTQADALLSALINVDILVKDDDSRHLTLVPDLLGDIMLDSAAVHETLGESTDFVARAWNTLYPLAGQQLLQRLTAADWRLRKRGFAGITDPIWPTLRTELANTDVSGLYEAAQRLRRFTHAQPHHLMTLIGDIARRLITLGHDPTGATPTRGPLTATHFNAEQRQRFRLPQLTPAEVNNELAPLLAHCARNAQELLEDALDHLWRIHRELAPLATLHPDAAAKAAAQIGDLASQLDASVPLRIVKRVAHWLQNDTYSPAATPLFALEPLLAKQGEASAQTAPSMLALHTYLINASWARPIRDEIRQILRECGGGADTALAAQAVALLKNALQPPRPLYGFVPKPEDLAQWTDDDVATLDVLADITSATGSAVIRRVIREALTPLAHHAHDTDIQHAALKLITHLDNCGDELAEVLMNTRNAYFPDQFGKAVPTIDDLTHRTDTGTVRPGGDVVVRMDRERAASLQRCFSQLDLEHRLDDALDTITATVTAASAARRTQYLPFHWFGRHLATNHTELCSAISVNISRRPPSPLDDVLAYALSGWAEADEPSFLQWLESFGAQRDAVRSAVGAAMNSNGWTGRGEAFRTAYEMGIEDPEPSVRSQFHLAAHKLLAEQPATTVHALLATGITATAASTLIETAAQFGRAEWVDGLDRDGIDAVLQLASHADVNAHGVQATLARIARKYTTDLLDFLLKHVRRGHEISDTCGDFPESFASQPEAVATWLVKHLPADTDRVGDVLALAFGDGIDDDLTIALADKLPALGIAEIRGVLNVLDDRTLWPLGAPTLADELIVRVEEIDPTVVPEIVAALRQATTPRVIGWVHGTSDELEHALTLATTLSTSEVLCAHLRNVFREAAESIRADIADIKDRYDREPL
jgi:hypothetical protein